MNPLAALEIPSATILHLMLFFDEYKIFSRRLKGLHTKLPARYVACFGISRSLFNTCNKKERRSLLLSHTVDDQVDQRPAEEKIEATYPLYTDH